MWSKRRWCRMMVQLLHFHTSKAGHCPAPGGEEGTERAGEKPSVASACRAMPEEGPSCWAPLPPICHVCTAAAEIESQSFLPPNGTGWNPRSVTESYTVMIMCSLSFPELCISNTSTHREPEWAVLESRRCLYSRECRKPSDESNAFMLAYSPVSRITEMTTAHLSRSDFTVCFFLFFSPFNITVLILTK